MSFSTVTLKVLFEGAQAPTADTTKYTAGAGVTTIIDKFTATNTTASAATLTVNLVPSAGSVAASNEIISALSIAANTCVDLSQLQNQILAAGDFISVKAGTGSAITVRASGREVT